jgi:hypothetical protein
MTRFRPLLLALLSGSGQRAVYAAWQDLDGGRANAEQAWWATTIH